MKRRSKLLRTPEVAASENANNAKSIRRKRNMDLLRAQDSRRQVERNLQLEEVDYRLRELQRTPHEKEQREEELRMRREQRQGKLCLPTTLISNTRHAVIVACTIK